MYLIEDMYLQILDKVELNQMRLYGMDYYVKGPSLPSLRKTGRWQFSGVSEHCS